MNAKLIGRDTQEFIRTFQEIQQYDGSARAKT